MNAFRKALLATVLAAGAIPGLTAAAEPVPEAQARAQEQKAQQQRVAADQQETAKRLEEARARLEKDAAEVAQLSGQMGRGFAFQLQGRDGGPTPRALLGVNIEPSSGDAKGARVHDVSPGSAAAEAGIKTGDVITTIGGQDLTKENDPGRALVDKMRQTEPNQKLQVGVLRDGKKMNFDVTPRPAPPTIISQVQRMAAMPAMPGRPGAPGMETRRFELQRGPGGADVGVAGGPGERRIEIRTTREGPDDGTRFRGLEFATLSEKLGGYFGVKSGVLVVRAGANSPFKLQDGDVILAVDGRELTSAQQAGRILRSYGDGEKLTLRVQRDRKAQNIESTMPGGGPNGGVGSGPGGGRNGGEDRDRRN